MFMAIDRLDGRGDAHPLGGKKLGAFITPRPFIATCRAKKGEKCGIFT